MERLRDIWNKWVSLPIRQSFIWQASTYLPDVKGVQIALWCGKAAACACFLSWFFYRSMTAAVALIPLMVMMVWKEWENWRKKMLLKIEEGFREWLICIKSSLAAGRSMEQAIRLNAAEFAQQAGEGHPVLLGLEQLYKDISLKIPLEAGLQRFGQETGIDSIQDFSRVFSIARRQGNQMSGILNRTIQIISDRTQLRLEMQAMLASRRMEHSIMCIVPFAIILLVNTAQSGYFASMYHNKTGIGIMTGCLGVYLLGFAWGRKMTEVTI